MKQERIALSHARRAHTDEYRRANPASRGITDPFGLVSYVLHGTYPSFKNIFPKFNLQAHVQTPEGAVLAESQTAVEEAAETYAVARTERRRHWLGNAAESADFRKGLEIARALREREMTAFERGIGKVIRTALKTPRRALATGVLVVGLGVYIYLPAVLAAGSIPTVSAIGAAAYAGLRTLGRYSHYVYHRTRDLMGRKIENVNEFAKRYNQQRDRAGLATIFGGIGLGSLLATEWAHATAEWADLHSAKETLRETVPAKREAILHAIEEKRGIPEYVPKNDIPLSVLSETDITYAARISSPILSGIHERIARFVSGRMPLLNVGENRTLLDEGLQHLKRLETLEAARVQYEDLSKHGGDTVTLAFLKRSLLDLERERAATSEWVARFDAASAEASENFAHEHKEGLLQLSAEYAVAAHQKPVHGVHTELFPTAQPIEGLPLTAGDLSRESFETTAGIVQNRLAHIRSVLDHYQRIIGNDGARYDALVDAKAHYTKLSGDLESLRPYFENFNSVRAEMGGVDSHSGEGLTEALLRERVRQVDFSGYRSWDAVTSASAALARVKPGTVMLNDTVTPLANVVSFKEGALPYLPEAMSHTMYELDQKLQSLGLPHMLISEGHPARAHHLSTCHQDGTCADFILADRNYTPERIWKVIQVADNERNFVIWEADSVAERLRKVIEFKNYLISQGMNPAYAEKLANERIQHFSTTTGEHFHFQCRYCEGALPAIAANDTTAVHAKAVGF